ncbi:hypothetical protein [Paracoccus marinaquae]|uniref:Uncharacterized protein n=1 Tax=Paracoccus marinaquae TaxID=2841926 RepID=A0ABS6AHI4_9RHOB|nr:hypothetical protein [Paracoccus marinaquae]MBU3030065.1 hypothetical protein [Paracoccus marinaquae]
MRMTILAATAALIAPAQPVSATPAELSRLMSDYVRACMLAGSHNVVPTMMQVINDLDGDGQPEFLLDANRACDAPTPICAGDEPDGCSISFWLSSAEQPSWQGTGLAAGIVGDALVVRQAGPDCEGGGECYRPVFRIVPASTAPGRPDQPGEQRVSDAVLPSSAAPATSPRPPRPENGPRAEGAQPQETAVTGTGLPPALQASTDEMIAICNDVGGGGSGVRDDPAYLQSADLNGDGVTDYVQYVGGIECVGAYSYWGGSAGFPATVWLSGPGGHAEHPLGYSQDVPQIRDGAVRTFLHGQLCDPPRIGADGCEKVTQFR